MIIIIKSSNKKLGYYWKTAKCCCKIPRNCSFKL